MAKTFPSLIQPRLLAALKASSVAAELPDDFTPSVDPAQNPKFGDYQSNAAMILANRLKMNPREFAAEVVELFDSEGLTETPEIAGPGFINFRLLGEVVEQRVSDLIEDTDRIGVDCVEEPQKIVIDFSAPNVAKPMHVGHIRGTIIGDSLTRIARFLGHEVITDNHIGDWGTQFGMILYGWKNELDHDALGEDPIVELVKVYKLINERCKEDESFKDTCRAELVKLQSGDEENLEIWQKCIELSKQGLQKIYDKLDIQFDHWLGESYYNDRLGDLVTELKEKGIATESDGAMCIFFPDDKKLADQPPAIIQKKDGGFLYATTDLATVEHRVNEFDADSIWYVVGAPQQLHFDQVFCASRMMGFEEVDLQFIPFGSILGKDKKMLKTREGSAVQLDDVLNEAVSRASKIVDEKNPDLSTDEKQEIGQAIGIGAVKYAELSQYRMTDYIFDWDTMLALKGNTAPYLLNAYVRTRAIFRKMGSEFEGVKEVTLSEAAERALALKLAQYGEVVPAAMADFKPNTLAAYIYDLATDYHKFWEACPVLKSEGAVKESRLALCELTSRVLKHSLGLLGIQTTEKM